MKSLRAKALAATQGKWEPEMEEHMNDDCSFFNKPTGWILNVVEYEGCGSHRPEWEDGNFEYVLAANPQVIIELLDRLERLESERAIMVEALDNIGTCGKCSKCEALARGALAAIDGIKE
jgi:hypothetical protein